MLLVAGVALPLLVMSITLKTTVTDRRITIGFRPFPGREIDPGDVVSVEAIRYDPLRDAGGWGWRTSGPFHRVFNVSGDRGVHVRLGEGHREQFVVGSRRAEVLAEAIELARVARRTDPIPGLVDRG